MSLGALGSAFKFYMEFQNQIEVIQKETASLKVLIEK